MQIYGDEEIIAKFVEEEETEKRHREQSVTINGLDYHFERRELAAAGISLMLPIEFQQMPVDIAQQKYLSEQRPEVILTNTMYTVDFTLMRTELQFNKLDVMQHLNEIQAVRKKMHPEDLFLDMEIIELEDIQLGCVQFVSYTVDGQALNVVLVLPYEEKMVLCTFTCDYDDTDIWKPIVEEMVETIQPVKGAIEE